MIKKLTAVFLFLFSLVSYSQTVIPVSDELILPQYAITGNSTPGRLQYVCRLKLTGLTANATYRYFPGMSTSTSILTATSPGNMIGINNTSGTYGYIVGHTSNKSMNGNLIDNDEFTGAGRYNTFVTDGTGSYTGWFCVVPTSNAVFDPGDMCYFYVQVNNGSNGTSIDQSFRTTNTITILDYGTTSGGLYQATAVMGKSFTSNEQVILLYDNTGGTGRPIYGTYTENDGISTNFSTWYNTSGGVEGYTGRWGAVIPNDLPNGIMRIERRPIDNTTTDYSLSGNGSWNAVNTVNPSSGTTPLQIDSTASPLPVILSGFYSSSANNNVSLTWSTSTEINNSGFEVHRYEDFQKWKNLGFVPGHGNTNSTINYSFEDKFLNTGKYYYRLKQIDYNGNFEYFNLSSRVVIGTPAEMEIKQNFPNPFNPETMITFSIPENSAVELKVFDIAGKVIKELVNTNLGAGYHSAMFNGSDLASGIYFYRLIVKNENGSTNYSKVMKMLLVK